MREEAEVRGMRMGGRNKRRRQEKEASALISLPVHTPPHTLLPPPHQAMALSWGNGSLAAVAWSTHFVVFSAPWEASEVTTVSSYTCEQVRGYTLALNQPPAIALAIPLPAPRSSC